MAKEYYKNPQDKPWRTRMRSRSTNRYTS